MCLGAAEVRRWSPMAICEGTGGHTHPRWGRCRIGANEQAFTLIELLITSAIGVVMLLGLGSFYLSTLRIYEQGNAQTALQRQATLALEEMTRQIRPARALFLNTCNGVANALTVRNANGDYCFYQSAENQLVEQLPPPDGTRNLLAGTPTPIFLAPGSLTFAINGRQVGIEFTLSEGTIDPWIVKATLKRRN